MIKILNTKDKTIAQAILNIQHLGYRIEADLIDFEGIPPLHESIDDILNCEETFLGFFVDENLAGLLSYTLEDAVLDIGRLVVDPNYFRRGIGKKLVQSVEQLEGINKLMVS
jgi:GNAT superfamily N-acetyltransferase